MNIDILICRYNNASCRFDSYMHYPYKNVLGNCSTCTNKSLYIYIFITFLWTIINEVANKYKLNNKQH